MFCILEGQFATQFRILQKISLGKDFCATLFKLQKTKITISGAHNLDHSAIGTSDFPWSLYLMWFWFGLEILRLVYKTVFLKYWMVSILFVSKFQKNSTVHYKSWKKFLQNWAQRVSKEAELCADFKNVQNSCVKKFQKIFSQKNNWLQNFPSP